MTSWADVVTAEPALAERVRAAFAVRKHATLATLRLDGSPRISGTEVEFDDDGELHLGSMPGARKAQDLRRDPRLALHSPTVDAPEDDPSAWAGESKIAGLGIEVSDPGSRDAPHRFRVEVAEVVLTRVGQPPDHLVIESWHPGRGLERHERR